MIRKLTWDAQNMEQIAIETANDRDRKYVYALSVAVFHILEWIVKNEGRLLPNDK